ncbi:MAG: efflux RND transporter permease subunit [Thermodesulfobacteriota bacterium]|nr:efflux RND transporter permease subunit [Thermodesulfobacteriota bacterium]
MKQMIAWFADNHVAANLMMLFLLLAGIVTAVTMKVEVFPETAPDWITITVVYPGASPSDVEEAVVERIEENIAGLSGIKRIDATAREGFGTVVVEVLKGWDMAKLLDDIKAEVDRITTFPEEAEKPIVKQVVRQHSVISVAVFGDVPEAVLKHTAQRLKDDITNQPGITQADVTGVRDEEIHVTISEETLRRYHLTLGQVAQIISRESLDLPAGNIKTSAGEILIRAKGLREYAKEYAGIAVITDTDGSTVTLDQIAEIREGFEDQNLITRFSGKPAAIIQVSRIGNQNAIDVAAAVRRFVNERKNDLPPGVAIQTFYDLSSILKSRIRLLLKNMAYGLILVSLLLGLVLNVRLAFWVTLGIPISFATGLWLLPYFGISINMISLFAFIMVLGIVVDDAIIIGENIFAKQEQGLSAIEAARQGATEMARPVIFAVLTTMAAFYPLLLGSGVMGKIMYNIPIVIILVLAGSLLESLLILPSHLLHAGVSKRRRQHSGRNSGNGPGNWLKRFIEGPYRRTVDFCITWRYITLAASIMLLLATLGLMKGGWIGFTFMPDIEGDRLSCTLTMPPDTPFEETVIITKAIEAAAMEVVRKTDKDRPDNAPSIMEYSVTTIGMHRGGHTPMSGGNSLAENLAQVDLFLLDSDKRDVSAQKLERLWREKTGPVPQADSLIFESKLFSAGNPIEVHLSMDDHDQLEAAADEMKARLTEYNGVFDVRDSFIPGKQEIRFALKPTARSLGVTLNDLAMQARHAFYGAEALRMQRGTNEVKVMVKYPQSDRTSMADVHNMRIRLASGAAIPLREVADITIQRGYSSIEHAQRRRIIKVMANVDQSVTNATEVRQHLTGEYLKTLQQKYAGLRYTIEGEGKEQQQSLEDVMKGFIIAAFVIYALLAVPFKSFSQPLVVMCVIPFGAIGALAGHLLMGYKLCILSLFGIVGLAGVVVNDSLVFIHTVNDMRSEGKNSHDALVETGTIRFRPIILTSLTTFAGLAPMIMERSLQARFLIPMAISLGFGILFATVITLLIIPSAYMVLEDVLAATRRLKEILIKDSPADA